MALAWVNANFKVCYLTQQYRQEGNTTLTEILNEIRATQISVKSIEELTKAQEQGASGILNPTKLFTHNADVDKINRIELEKLTGRSKKI